jgi:hypothetical protein
MTAKLGLLAASFTTLETISILFFPLLEATFSAHVSYEPNSTKPTKLGVIS